jgi:predicted permease
VISDAFWRRRFDADPRAVGRVVAINGWPFTIVGVAPPGFSGPMNGLAAEAWLPMMMQTAITPGNRLNERGSGWLQAFARMAPGVSRREAQAALDVVAARLATDHPGTNTGRRLLATPIWTDGAGAILLPILNIVMAVVALVLLIACANVAGLLLARASGRRREIAVRLAIGASRGRLVRQLLAEATLLATAGGAAALLLTVWTSRLFTALMPPLPFPVRIEGAVNWRVFLFAMGVSLTAALVFGLVPALAGSSPALTPSLKDGGAGRPRARLRQGLVVAQVALSMVLLVGAGLFLRTLQNAAQIDPGFDARDGFFARLDLQAGGYDDASGPAFYRDVLERVDAVPGVSRATLATFVPLTIGGGSDTSARIEGYTRAEHEQMVLYYSMVAPGYFDTLGVPIVRGRGIDTRDAADAPLAVVINETMAKRYWADGDAVGKRLDYGGGWTTVIGIARDGKYNAIHEPPRNFMYIPLHQVFRTDVALIVRTAGDSSAVFPAVQRAVRALNANLPLFDVMTVAEHLRASVFIPRLAASLLALFGTLALGLAGLGLYGVMAYVATQRTQEIGIRMALGADRAAIRRLFLTQGLRLAGIGVLIGGGLAALLAPLLASQLVGVGATDLATFGVTVGVLIVAALLASYLPARRAAAVDPLRALRYE